MNPTNDPALRSFVPVGADSDFPIQNLPYGVFRRQTDQVPHAGVRIGDFVLDLKRLEHDGLFRGLLGADERLFAEPSLNRFMAQGVEVWSDVRAAISELLRADNPTLRDNEAMRQRVLVPIEQVELLLPVEIGDYTDFYSSKYHAHNVGVMFRGADNALMPNYVWLPVGYHGRASSVVLSGTPVHRPCGQTRPDDKAPPVFGPSHMLDFELEMGFFTGPGNPLGRSIPIERAEDHIFGLTLVNDWSARDVQKWEYVPLGPFLGKNFATTVSPWIVPLEALEPFRCAGPAQDPAPLDYLRLPPSVTAAEPQYAYDIRLEVSLTTEKTNTPHVICRSNFRHLYWTMVQQLAHHSAGGCNLRPGDLLASGTISGPTPESFGSMLELAWRGERPLTLPSGEQRRALEDGDTIIMRAWCEGEGYRLGFGECTGRVLRAKSNW
ncbi:MAG: fumarylacetoacetase [Phycisphaerae bacterium]|jgi:fumarylacetoacetase